MPFGDGTGPQGLGPMTGRGAGYCAGYGVPGYLNPFGGRYFRRHWGIGWFGRGRGWRNWARATGLPGWWRASIGLPAFGGQIYPPYGPELTSDQEKEILTQELKDLKEEIKAIEKRLGDLKGSKKIKVEEE